MGNKTLEKQPILITGIAGFIGHALAKKIAGLGYAVVGIDNLNDYYDVELKHARLQDIGLKGPFENQKKTKAENSQITFYKADLRDSMFLKTLFSEYGFKQVVNLAAQAGVRYSIVNPQTYIDSNISGLVSLLETCKDFSVERILFASSSSVYGSRFEGPFTEDNNTDYPVSLYAATKKANEVIAHSYSSLYGIQTIGIRFFTVYGPWGRPDMAPMKFLKKMLNDEKIEIYNNGQMTRDFTFIGDVVEIVSKVISLPIDSFSDYELFNIGSSKPIKLMDFIKVLEEASGIRAKKAFLKMQQGDVKLTHATSLNVLKTINYLNFSFKNLHVGIKELVVWNKEYSNQLEKKHPPKSIYKKDV